MHSIVGRRTTISLHRTRAIRHDSRKRESERRERLRTRSFVGRCIWRAHAGLYKGKQVRICGEPLYEVHYSDRLLVRLLEVYHPEKFGRRAEPAVWDGDLSKLTTALLEKVTGRLIADACNQDPALVEQMTSYCLAS
jgi:hypothetical protein